jgi:hypothetical protein
LRHLRSGLLERIKVSSCYWTTEERFASQGEVLAHDTEVLKACLEPMRIAADDPDPRWCAIDRRDMQAWLTFLRDAGTIREPIELGSLYTTALVDMANAFDPGEVQGAATAYAARLGLQQGD